MAERVEASGDGPQPVELVNVPFAGPLITSAEPERVAGSVPLAVEREFRLRARVVDSPDPAPDRAQAPELPQVPGIAPETVAQLVASAAALEQTAAPLEVWHTVAQAVLDNHTSDDTSDPSGTAEQPSDPSETSSESPLSTSTLRALVDAWPDVLTLGPATADDERAEEAASGADADGTGDRARPEELRFADTAVHRAVRAAFPVSRTDHRAIANALTQLHRRRPTTTYTAWALPTHAALAQDIEQVLDDPALLATLHWYGLWSGLATAYPDGVPGGGTAADVHFLHAQGVRPGSQGEWVASLHHAAVSRGDGAQAEALAEAAGPLPWRTLWSHWRLPGGPLVAYPAQGGVQQVRAAEEDGRRLIAEWRETGAAPTDEDETDGTGDEPREVYERRRWDAWSGQPADGPERIVSAWPELTEQQPFAEVAYAANRSRGWRQASRGTAEDVPRMPEAVREAVRLARDDAGAELWVFAGYGGLFGALVDHKAVSNLPRTPWRNLLAPGPLTSSAAWPFPQDIPRTDDEVTRERLERADAFRDGACRPVEPAALPDELTHEPSRRFLSGTGWPCTRVIGGLYTLDLGQSPLQPSDDHPGMLEGLGQLASWKLYVDGESGAVLVDEDDELLPVARSMPRLLALALLNHLVLSAPLTSSELEMEALSETLPSWVAAIDPDAADSPAWEGAFDDLAYEAEDYGTLLDELDGAPAE
ncbi:hypothetical protein [Streptomyces sp. NPDC088785]|uniref:hypothetical protein n=1 Tax=Streptomyces sp. NPDC088785 TaxID=3365897 RepID=UPI0037F583BA